VRKIEAIVYYDNLDALYKAFLEAGIQKMTVTEVRDYGNSKAHTEIYRSAAFSVDSLAKVKVETIVPQNKVPAAVSILKIKGQTGKGENKIIISSVNDVGDVSIKETVETAWRVKKTIIQLTHINERSFMKLFLTIMVSFIVISFSTGIRAAQSVEQCSEW